jgi:hypothetical protein
MARRPERMSAETNTLLKVKSWQVGLAIALSFLAIAASEIKHHGLALDAPALFYAGDRSFYWLTHPSQPLDFHSLPPAGFHTIFRPYPEAWDLIHYPVFPDLVASATSLVLADGLGWLHPVQAHEFGLVLLHAVALFLLTTLAWSLLGPLPGTVTALCYLFFPTVLGHAFTNPKDLPCTDFYACGLLAGALAAFEPVPRRAVTAGVLFGIALSCKINAVIGLANWLAWLAVYLALDWRRQKRVDLRLIALGAFVPVLAFLVFFLLWPWLYQGAPSEWIAHVVEYWRFYADYAGSPRTTWTAYPLRNVIYMTPPLVTSLAAIYLFGEPRRFRSDERALLIWGLLSSWTLIPILRIALPHSNFYDANRHFIEYTGGICAMAGCGAAVVDSWLRERLGDKVRAVIPALAAAGFLSLLAPWLLYRPYESSYYNFLIGGLGGAQRTALNYMDPPHDHRVLGTEGDYWYTSVADADRALARLVPEGSSVGVCGPPYPTMEMQWFGPGPVPPISKVDLADYIYVNPREAFCGWGKARRFEAERPVLVRVVRGGGLIYEILGPPDGSLHSPVSPRTAYEAGE